jgi:hypothetical protein
MTNFEVDFLASPMDGRTSHIHQITKFRPYDNYDPIRLTENKSVRVDWISNVKINGIVVWEDAEIQFPSLKATFLVWIPTMWIQKIISETNLCMASLLV